MPRGGRREGTQGKQYPNRSDLRQPVRVPPSKTYGEGAAMERAQQAIPLPQTVGPGGGEVPASPPGPLSAEGLGAPTARPTEPLTAGMAMGPGPGPGAAMPAVDPVLEAIRAAARDFPNPAIFALLEAAEGSR